jgi:hypothetical protein
MDKALPGMGIAASVVSFTAAVLKRRYSSMLKILGAAILLFVVSLPAHAQVNMGGSLNTASQILPHYEPLSVSYTYYAGTIDFVPSDFLTYDQAVTKGNELIAQGQKSLGEVARESRERSAQKAAVTVVQNDNGDIVFAQTRKKNK